MSNRLDSSSVTLNGYLNSLCNRVPLVAAESIDPSFLPQMQCFFDKNKTKNWSMTARTHKYDPKNGTKYQKMAVNGAKSD